MHHCLNVDEIVRFIALELVESEGNATAVSLACCCKGFEDPALDVLWARPDGLDLLFKLFPGDVWSEHELVSVSITCVFFFSLMVRLDSALKDSRRWWNGLVSGSTPKGYDKSCNTTF